VVHFTLGASAEFLPARSFGVTAPSVTSPMRLAMSLPGHGGLSLQSWETYPGVTPIRSAKADFAIGFGSALSHCASLLAMLTIACYSSWVNRNFSRTVWNVFLCGAKIRGMAKLARPAPSRFGAGTSSNSGGNSRLTQEQLAERIGVTPGAISQLELGRVNYTQPCLEAIATEFGVGPGEFLNVDPSRDEAMWSIWETLDVPTRNQVVDIVKTFQKTGTDN
jgi:DNA-binding XRE family transcriptional regulator